MKTCTSLFASVLATSLFIPTMAFAQNASTNDGTQAANPNQFKFVRVSPELKLLNSDPNSDELLGVNSDAANTATTAAEDEEFEAEYEDEAVSESQPKNYHVVDENSPVLGHGMQLGMSFLGVPGSLLDNWFAEHGNTWDGSVNMGFSLDYFLRFKRPCELRFSLSWVNARTGDAYWLDEDHSTRPQLADYITHNYSVLALEVTAYHVVPIIDEIAFYYGGGGWFGVTMGDAKSYAIRSSCATNTDDISVCPHEPGSVAVEGIPPVFGFVVATVGFKFTLFDMMTIRAEGGFKGYLYGQLGVGVEF